MKEIPIIIRFGDNDFGYSFSSILRTLNCHFIWETYPEYYDSKEFLLKVINNISIGHYLLTEGNFLIHPNFRNNYDEQEVERIKNYMQLNEESLLVGDEAMRYYTKKQRGKDDHSTIWAVLGTNPFEVDTI